MTVAGRSAVDARVVVDAAALEAHAAALLEALGVPSEDAATTAGVFAQAETMGEESHGMRLFLVVLQRLAADGDRAATEITRLMDHGAIALWDANRSLGQAVAARAMRRAIEKARVHGLGLVAVRNGNSLTSAKYYALQAAEAGMAGFVFTNASRKVMPAPGGVAPVIGNNPVAFAVPAGSHGMFVLDMACTAAAIERIVDARNRGQPIPADWALDRDGQPTTDPTRALEAMTLLPFGGHKAFGLAVVHEIMTSVLSGGALLAAASTGFFPLDGPMHTSFSLLAIDIGVFQPVSQFERRMEALITALKRSARKQESGEVLVPGERSQRERKRRLADGVPLTATTFDGLHAWASRLGVDPLECAH